MLSFWFRTLVWWGARLLGVVWRTLQHGLVLQLLVVGAIAAALWLADQPLRTPAADATNTAAPASPPAASSATPSTAATDSQPAPQHAPWFTATNVLAGWALVLIAVWVWHARRRLVVGRFDDYADKQTGIDPGGFGVLVATELARLSSLFGEFEEGRSLQSMPEKLAPVNAAIQTESSGEFLQKTVSAESKLSIGPLSIPVGFIMTLVGQMVQGPRLAGQLHRDGDRRLITVRLLGSLGERAWSVSDPAVAVQPDGRASWRAAAELAQDLACDIFAELALDRTVSGAALARFAAGVRSYRRSLRTPRRRRLDLKEAEHQLLLAVSEDPRFDLAYYNLGVTYTALHDLDVEITGSGSKQLDAARRAFERALAANNRRWGTYYALALTNFWVARRDFDAQRDAAAHDSLARALELCDQALRLAPAHAETAHVLALKSFVHWWRGGRAGADPPGRQFREFQRARIMARRAIRKSWWALCRSEFGIGLSDRERSVVRGRARQLASRHLQNRSDMLLEIARLLTPATAGAPPMRASNRLVRRLALREAAFVLRQACMLTPAEASVHFDLGEVLLQRGADRAAGEAFATAARLAPTAAGVWGHLAQAQAAREHLSQALESIRRLLDDASGATPAARDATLTAIELLKQLPREIQAFAAAMPAQVRKLGRLRFLPWFLGKFFRFSYRLAGRDPLGLSVASERLKAALQNPGQLDDTLRALDALETRVRALTTFAGDVQALVDKGEAGVAPLVALLAEKQAAGHAWEVAEAGHQLILLYERLNRPAEAGQCARDTIAYLEQTAPQEIQRRGLQTLLARMLRSEDRAAEALDAAKQATSRDPMSAYERTELGRVYQALAEYPAAQSVWEDALSLTPEDPRLHVNLGLVNLQQLDDCVDPTAWAARLATATRHLHTALELFADDDPGRFDARFLLARVYSDAGRHADELRELRALDRSDYHNLAVAIHLADAFLGSENYAEAERRFRLAADDVRAQMAAAPDGANQAIDTPPGSDAMVLGTAFAYAHLGIAASLAEREIFLDQASAAIEQARTTLAGLRDTRLRDHWLRLCDYQEGVVLTRQDRIDAAIARLESALALHSSAVVYLALATALARQAELTAEAGARARIARRATLYFHEARRLDRGQTLETRIARGLAQLPPASAA